MVTLWLVVGAALVLGVVAWLRISRLSRRLERLTQSYWDLRYEHGQLAARLAREDSGGVRPSAAGPAPVQPGPAAFVPLSALKR
jgi:hypothetical protein